MDQRPKRRNHNPLVKWIPVLSLILAALILVACSPLNETPPIQTDPITLPSTGPAGETSQPETQSSVPPSVPTPSESVPEVTPPPTAAPVVKLSTAKISATGDMLMHIPVINKYHIDGSYNFDGIFQHLRIYIHQADYAAANLETTLAGLDNGYKYSGYPNFNCPDYIIDGLKNAGFDLVLTANNHSYDTRHVGFLRTQQVIADRNLDHLGTKQAAEQPHFILRELNGICVGMMCYTYNTGIKESGSVSLNNIPLTPEDSKLVNSFSYRELDSFYAEMEQNLTQMKSQGVEATVLFIHWGDEYHTEPNSTQKAMAQKLCDLGIDVIIGGHPHVVQPVELLTSTVDSSKKTVCLYSMGNAVSNQLKGNLSNSANAKGYTEDGVLFSVTFAKYSDGTVILESAELLPTWVNRQYHILPLDKSLSDWKTAFGVTDSYAAQMNASYDRTWGIVGPGMTTVENYLTQHVKEVETKLGITK